MNDILLNLSNFSIHYKMIDLFHQIYSIKIKISRTKTFLNESFNSNKKTHIEEFKKIDLL